MAPDELEVPGREPDPGPAPLSALPSTGARVAAFCAIVVAGVCGGLIGTAVVRVQCHGSCGTPRGIGFLTGALVAASGVAVIAVLVLRAMGEWSTMHQRRGLPPQDRPT